MWQRKTLLPPLAKFWIGGYIPKMAKYLCFLLLLLTGCGIATPIIRSQKRLADIKPFLNEQQVKDKIGEPDTVRAYTILASDLSYSIQEYWLYPQSDALTNLALGPFTLTLSWWVPNNAFTNRVSYWLHYINGELRYWGEAGDWAGAPSEIVEIRHTSGDRINLK
jgi:hypothetical protein